MKEFCMKKIILLILATHCTSMFGSNHPLLEAMQGTRAEPFPRHRAQPSQQQPATIQVTPSPELAETLNVFRDVLLQQQRVPVASLSLEQLAALFTKHLELSNQFTQKEMCRLVSAVDKATTPKEDLIKKLQEKEDELSRVRHGWGKTARNLTWFTTGLVVGWASLILFVNRGNIAETLRK
jgi:hypothetical protein